MHVRRHHTHWTTAKSWTQFQEVVQELMNGRKHSLKRKYRSLCTYLCVLMCVRECNVRVWLRFCVDHLNTAVNKARWVERPDCEVVLLCRYQVSGSVSCLCCSNTHPLPASFILLSAARLHRGFTGDKEESVSFSDTPLSPVITLNKSCFQLHALHDCYSIFITHSVQPWMLPRMRRHKCLTWIKLLSLTEQLPNMWN